MNAVGKKGQEILICTAVISDHIFCICDASNTKNKDERYGRNMVENEGRVVEGSVDWAQRR